MTSARPDSPAPSAQGSLTGRPRPLTRCPVTRGPLVILRRAGLAFVAALPLQHGLHERPGQLLLREAHPKDHRCHGQRGVQDRRRECCHNITSTFPVELLLTNPPPAQYEYVNLDDCWQAEKRVNGHLVSHPVNFPSGIKALAKYAHDAG